MARVSTLPKPLQPMLATLTDGPFDDKGWIKAWQVVLLSTASLWRSTNKASRIQLLQNALRHQAKLRYCAFDLMFQDGEDLRELPLTERKKRLKAILPKHKLIAFSRD